MCFFSFGCCARPALIAGEHQKLAAQMKKAKEEFNEYERKDIQHQEGMKHFKEQVCVCVCVCGCGCGCGCVVCDSPAGLCVCVCVCVCVGVR